MSAMPDSLERLSPLQRAALTIRQLRSQLDAAEQTCCEPIAIVGMGCRFPGAAGTPEAYWNLLQDGRDVIGDLPAERWNVEAYFDPDPVAAGKIYTRRGYFLDDIDRFDPQFFGLSPREANSLDPQHRLLLEVAWEALEDAGQSPDRLAGSRTGIFIGIGQNDYAQLQLYGGDAARIGTYDGTGNGLCFASGRLAHVLGLHGPNLAIDTACSSSLVAVHLACQSLRLRECDLALAGGVQLILSPEVTVFLCRARALSPDGRCKTFDASADGYGRGEGCGVIALKRLSDAQVGGDNVLAVIRGSAVNHNGPGSGLTVPSALAQQTLLQQAWAAARVTPAHVDYVETHGTGTSLGDPIEVRSLDVALGDARAADDRLLIGSVKTNIGHLEAAAGIAGLIKVVLALQRAVIPASLHFRTPNPAISWDESRVAVVRQPAPWPSRGERRIAGVSSFGISGTNAHVVLEAAMRPTAEADALERPLHLLALSAKSRDALLDQARRLHGRFGEPNVPDIADACFTANAGRAQHRFRLALVADSVVDLKRQLAEFATDRPGGDWCCSDGNGNVPLAWLFTGQGAQYRDMGRALYETQPTFRRIVDECDAMLRPQLKPSLREAWFAGAGDGPLDETLYTQPALFALEYALAQLWEVWGVEPAALLGHSVGEYVAACRAGVFGLEDALRLVAARGRLMHALPRNGLMAAVAADQARVLAFLGARHAQVSVAAVNGPRNTVISGARAAVEALIAELARAGINATPLRTSHAFHSPLVEPMLEEFGALAAGVRLSPPQLPLISNVTGEVAGDEIATAEYWCRHARQPVLFAKGLSTLASRGCRAFLEVGPAPVLLGMGRQVLAGDDLVWLPSLRPGMPDWRQMLDSLARWYVRGAAIEWDGFDRDYSRRRVGLPTYPFQRQRYWVTGPRPLRAAEAPVSANWIYRIEWQRAPSPAVHAGGDAPGCWLILADRSGLGCSLADALERGGHRCLLVGRAADAARSAEAGDVHALRQQLDAFAAEVAMPLRGAVYLWSLDAPEDEVVWGDALVPTAAADCSAALTLAQALADRPEGDAARLWLVTRSAVPAADEAQRLNLPGAALWGLGRSIALEQPRLWGGLVDLDARPGPDEAQHLLVELCHPDGENQVAFRADGRRVARLVGGAPLPETPGTIRSDACYLVTGGVGFIGLELAAWLARRGAKHLVLAGRSEPTPHARARIAALEQGGAEVRLIRSDVADQAALARLLEQIAAELPPLRGIIHAAGVAGRQPLADIDAPSLAAVLRPKLAGTWLLDRLTAHLDLDFFVCLSSIASVWGAKGQAHYAAANQFLDAWAHDRRARGLRALSLNCGPWSGGGMAAHDDRQWLERSGIGTLAPGQYLAALARLLASDACQAVVVDADWSVFGQLYSARAGGRLLEQIRIPEKPEAAPEPSARPPLRAELQQADAAKRRRLLADHLQREVAAVLGFPAERLPDLREGFFQLGMDSLMALELRSRLVRALGEPLPAAIVFDFPTVDALATALLELITWDTAAVRDAAPAMPAAAAAATREPIAIVGIACRFPGGADDPDRFWQLLCEGRDGIRRVPAQRWDPDAYYDPEPGKAGSAYTQHGGFIDDVDRFDAQYFGISPREAADMDPQHRLLLELSHAAFESAGQPFGSDALARTGVFVGLTQSEYAQMLLGDGRPDRIGAYYVTGNLLNAAAGRLSYALGLKGPSMTVDTACSSSLVAVHLACRSLWERECNAALAGGANLILSPASMVAACQARMLSADGRCKTFDAAADGYGRGEGAGVVVLKRLSDAQAAGDRIWALILGTAVNQDGRSSGFTVPSGLAQQEVIRAALECAGIRPEEVGYIEAHGTGTALGDPIEAGALGAVFATSRRGGQPLPVGAVKTNIGHLESAAGIAGLIKAALVVHHGEIPRLPHLSTPNPEIDWDRVALRAVAQHVSWPGDRRRVAGVSSFGVSGTNAHVVIAAPPDAVASEPSWERPLHLLTISAKTPPALRQLAADLAAHLDANPGLTPGDVCFTLNARSRHAYRAAWGVASIDQVRERLNALAQTELAPDCERAAAAPPRICFVFDDEHALPSAAAAELYATQPLFRGTIDRLASETASLLARPLTELLFGDTAAASDDPACAWAATFALEYALAELWRAWGIAPDLVFGEGPGALAAACIAGVFRAEDALRLCIERARRMSASGTPVNQPTADADVVYTPPRVGFICSRSGALGPAEVGSPEYWNDHVAHPSQLASAFATAQREGASVFVELGARGRLLEMGRACLHGGTALWLPSVDPGRPAWEGLVEALAALYLAGGDVDLRGFDRGYARSVVPLPTYPFQRRRYWIEDRPGDSPQTSGAPEADSGYPLLGRRLRSVLARDEIEYAARISVERLPFLADHRLFGALLLPSSALLEMILTAAGEVVGETAATVSGYRIHQAAALDPQHGRELHLVLRPQADAGYAFEILGAGSGPDADSAPWVSHATGALQKSGAALSAADALSVVQARLRQPLPVAEFYERLRQHGIDLGRRFQLLQRLHVGDGEALGEIRQADATPGPAGFRVDPVVLDACFQVVGAALASLPGPVKPHLQVGIERMTLHAPFGPHVWSHARLRRSMPPDAGPTIADARLYSPTGALLATIDGLQLQPADGAADAIEHEGSERLYEIDWQTRPALGRVPLPAVEDLQRALFERRNEWRAHAKLAGYGESGAAIEAQCPRLVVRALSKLGWRFDHDRPFTLDEAMQRLRVPSRYRRLLQRWLEMLAEDRWLVERAGSWQVGTMPGDAAEHPGLERLRSEHPRAASELELLERASRSLAGVLRGELDPTDVLFPDGDLDLLTRLYADSPIAAMMNSLVERAVTAAIAGWASGRPLRILEIGAGTGATTASLLPHLPADRTEYVFTDVADRFTQAAAQRFRAYPFVRYELLNIEDDPAVQGFESRQFDIVVAANVLHATARLGQTLRNVRQLLAPGGLLVLLEGTAPLRFLDLTFGLTEGWWRFAGDPARPAYPLIPVAQWQALLEANGFDGFCHVASNDSAARAFPPQAVMMARATSQRPALPPGHWLVLADRGGVAEQLRRLLESHGEAATLIGRMHDSDPADVRIMPDAADDYRRVLRQALAHGLPLRGVVHLWSLDAELTERSARPELRDATELGCRSALYLAQALIAAQCGREVPLYLVTRGAVDTGGTSGVSTPDGLVQAPVWGLGKVLASEHAELRCRLIDLDPASGSDASLLFDELYLIADADETRVALRASERQVARLARSHPVKAPVPIRGDRSYLITGGFGGIGLHIAGWLAAHGARQLVLVGRGGAPATAAAAIRALEDAGVEIVAAQADVAESAQLVGVLARIARELLPLGGIVHAAGVFADRLIVDQQWPLFEQVFAPKIVGAWHLHQLSRDLPLDFFVLCSSASTLLGGSGLANYVAANEFLDALAAYRRRIGLPGLSIDWGPWADVGMARYVGGSRKSEWDAVGIQALTPAHALHALACALGGSAAQAGVMQLDWARFADSQAPAAVARFVEPLVPPRAAAPRHAPARQRIEGAPAGERQQLLLAHVRSEVEAVLGWHAGEHVNVRHGFFDLGMDSLQGNELRNRLQASLGCTLPPTLTFRFPTVAALAEHLAQELFGAGAHARADARTPDVAAAPVAPANLDAMFRHELAQLEQLLGG